jgi:glucan phosphorylase
MDVDILTLGFARRATAYKRMDLLFQDIERLKQLATHAGGLQVIYAGKAHPHDHQGKELIKRIYEVKDALGTGSVCCRSIRVPHSSHFLYQEYLLEGEALLQHS